ncbi:hypothetical protein B0H13DRAFT_1862888 [Mycena leptocephala]|nr:hypothetical protein B0H13DRAFT_1862888 [Mycena leptocephala]
MRLTDEKLERAAAAARRFAIRPVVHSHHLWNRNGREQSNAVPSKVDPQDVDCNEPETDIGDCFEMATNASTLIEQSQIDPVVSPYRFQLYLFRSRLDGATRFVEHHYPQHAWRLGLVEDNYCQLLQKFNLLSDRPILSTDLTVEFVFRYSSVTAHTESHSLPSQYSVYNALPIDRSCVPHSNVPA